MNIYGPDLPYVQKNDNFQYYCCVDKRTIIFLSGQMSENKVYTNIDGEQVEIEVKQIEIPPKQALYNQFVQNINKKEQHLSSMTKLNKIDLTSSEPLNMFSIRFIQPNHKNKHLSIQADLTNFFYFLRGKKQAPTSQNGQSITFYDLCGPTINHLNKKQVSVSSEEYEQERKEDDDGRQPPQEFKLPRNQKSFPPIPLTHRCYICKEVFNNYYHHISHPSHQRRYQNNNATLMISDLVRKTIPMSIPKPKKKRQAHAEVQKTQKNSIQSSSDDQVPKPQKKRSSDIIREEKKFKVKKQESKSHPPLLQNPELPVSKVEASQAQIKGILSPQPTSKTPISSLPVIQAKASEISYPKKVQVTEISIPKDQAIKILIFQQAQVPESPPFQVTVFDIPLSEASSLEYSIPELLVREQPSPGDEVLVIEVPEPLYTEVSDEQTPQFVDPSDQQTPNFGQP